MPATKELSETNAPAMIRGAINKVIAAAVNIWVWDYLLTKKELPDRSISWVYPRDLELGGPQAMNGYRVKVTFELEEI